MRAPRGTTAPGTTARGAPARGTTARGAPALTVRRAAVLATVVGPALGVVLALSGCGADAPPRADGTEAGASASASGGTPGDGATASSSPGTSSGARARGVAPRGYDGRYRVVAQVVQTHRDVPRLCAGWRVAMGPPSCPSGPEVVGWDWDDVPSTSVLWDGGTRSGSYAVTGTYDGAALVLTDPVELRPPDRARVPVRPRPSDACPEPAGGWTGSVPDLVAQQTQAQAAHEAATRVDGYTGFALDSRRGPGDEAVQDGSVEDLVRAVVVASTRGDVAAMEEAVRTRWSGDVCVLPAPLIGEELRRVRDEVGMPPGAFSVGVDDVRGVVQVEVLHARQEEQDAYDDAYGPGVVELTGTLVPVDP